MRKERRYNMFKKYKKQIKQLQEQNNELITKLEETNTQLSIEKSARSSLANTLQSLQIKYRDGYELDRIKEDIEVAKNVLADTKHQILETQVELDNINKELVQSYNKHEIQTMGLYDPMFPKYSTEEYKTRLKKFVSKEVICSVTKNIIQLRVNGFIMAILSKALSY